MKQYVGLDVSQDQTSICVVDESGRAAECRVAFLEEAHDIGLHGHVGLHCKRLPTGLAQIVGQALGRFAVAQVVEAHGIAGVRSEPCGRCADAAARSRDDDDSCQGYFFGVTWATPQMWRHRSSSLERGSTGWKRASSGDGG